VKHGGIVCRKPCRVAAGDRPSGTKVNPVRRVKGRNVEFYLCPFDLAPHVSISFHHLSSVVTPPFPPHSLSLSPFSLSLLVLVWHIRSFDSSLHFHSHSISLLRQDTPTHDQPLSLNPLPAKTSAASPPQSSSSSSMVSFTSTIKSVVMALALASSASAVPIEPRNNELDARGSYLQSQLFPAGGYSSASSWTTSTSLSPRFNLKAGLPIQKGKKPTTDKAPDGHSSIVSFFPAGSINPGNKDAPKGGFSFYSNGPSWGTTATAGTGVWQDDITRAKELTFGYSVFFQEGFQWNLGGKLPGVYGGSNEDIARSCSGGRQEDRDQCFSLRMMWRESRALFRATYTAGLIFFRHD
jgi:hypothetical protein